MGYEVRLSRLTNWEAGNKIQVTVLKEGKSVHQWDTHTGGAFVFTGSTLIYSNHHPNAPGCELVAFDLDKRVQLWTSSLKGIPVESGSQYENRINLRVDSDARKIRVLGNESYGRYIEMIDLKTGETLSNNVGPKENQRFAD